MNTEFLDWLQKQTPRGQPVQTGILQPGEQVGPWRICAFLATGGTSNVYRVESGPVSAALKIAHQVNRPTITKRFEQEVELLRLVSSSRFPRLLDCGVHEGHPFLVTELLHPMELPRADEAVARFILQVAEAVSLLHELGFVHRDIKPTNILTRDEKTPVLVDLGYARRFSTTPSAGMGQVPLSIEQSRVLGVGTPGYAAPEQFTGEFITPSSDIHALGVLLNDCFRGSPPSVWQPIIRRATSSLPAQRYKSIHEFVATIRHRHRGRIFLVLLATIVLLTGIWFVLSASGLSLQQISTRITQQPGIDTQFCVIDLSAGPSAPTYPVTYLNEMPDTGWTDTYKTEKLVLRRIDAGEDPLGRYSLSNGFYIGVFEITQKQWALIMGDRLRIRANKLPRANISFDDIRGAHKGAQWPHANGVEEDSFIGRLRQKTGLSGFDLPTVAQWQYACRAGTTTDYNTGCSPDTLVDTAWYKENSGGTTHEVGLKKPNDWGLYDMHGNVDEWCLDWGNGGNRTGESPVGPLYDDKGRRCKMGGSYAEDAHVLRTDAVYRCPSDRGFSDGGLRVLVNLVR